MSSAKTLASEFAAALGVQGLPCTLHSLPKIQNTTKAQHVVAAPLLAREEILAVHKASKHAGNSPLLQNKRIAAVRWLGDDKSNAIASRDLAIDTTPKDTIFVSVKLNSNMLWNKSPHKALNDFWFSNALGRKHYPDYYLQVARAELQDYYTACGGPAFTGCATVEKYYDTYTTDERGPFSAHVKSLDADKAVVRSYNALCRKVSQTAADTVNENIAILQLDPTHLVLPMWAIFRLNDFSYILTGMDNKTQLCMQVPAASSWEQQYRILSITAKDACAGQPQVDIAFTIENKRTKQTYAFEVFIELRWSHGKFGGNPEGKIQKRFNYASLPWLVDLRK